jgi:hypothetical protein
MAAHRDLWWPVLAEKALSRNQVLTMIAEINVTPALHLGEGPFHARAGAKRTLTSDLGAGSDCHFEMTIQNGWAVAKRRICRNATIAEWLGEMATLPKFLEPSATINGWLGENGKSAEFAQPPASRQHFDIWQFPTADRCARSARAF